MSDAIIATLGFIILFLPPIGLAIYAVYLAINEDEEGEQA